MAVAVGGRDIAVAVGGRDMAFEIFLLPRAPVVCTRVSVPVRAEPYATIVVSWRCCAVTVWVPPPESKPMSRSYFVSGGGSGDMSVAGRVTCR